MGNKLIYHLPDYAPLAVTPLAYWASTPAPTCCLPPPMVAPSPENESSPSLRCMKCPKMPKFSTQKDLERHLNTSQAHQDEGTPLYRCCCTRSRPRKDNHLRHVRTCIAESRGSYTCICGRESPVRDEHIEHVHNCGRVRRRQRSATT
ncbi:hypothetical protein F5Y10DRAFT_241980 [Nemania abortiva]|nr:hypothetical protein F5Y10DRAFT_241980 [Nemania abortiva]